MPTSGVDQVGELAARAQRWRAALAEVARCAVHAAIGTVAGDADGLAASHRSARESLAIGEMTARPLVRHDELLLERILLSVDPTRLAELVNDQIGPLIEADRTGSGALCQTLETFLGISNAAAAARRLYIHYNTMKHRMGRISELLDVDLHDPRTRLSLAVALAARALTSGAGSRTHLGAAGVERGGVQAGAYAARPRRRDRGSGRRAPPPAMPCCAATGSRGWPTWTGQPARPFAGRHAACTCGEEHEPGGSWPGRGSDSPCCTDVVSPRPSRRGAGHDRDRPRRARARLGQLLGLRHSMSMTEPSPFSAGPVDGFGRPAARG